MLEFFRRRIFHNRERENLMKQRGRKGPLSRGAFPKPHLVVPSPPTSSSSSEPEPPDHLAEPERAIWRNVLREFRGTEASLALLTSGLEAHERARQCREAIAQEGLTVDGADGQQKAHPLLAVERAAWRAFAQTFKMLDLKV
jgi:P27 family predicted phage terminase small subunit